MNKKYQTNKLRIEVAANVNWIQSQSLQTSLGRLAADDRKPIEDFGQQLRNPFNVCELCRKKKLVNDTLSSEIFKY